MSQLSEFDKGRIVGLYGDGYCISAISRALGYSKSTIHLWVKRMAEEGHVSCRPRPGRPRTTTEDQDKNILRCVDEDSCRTSNEIKNMLRLRASRSTIRRRLQKISTQKEETSPQLANQSDLTGGVGPLWVVDMSVPDVSGKCPIWTALETGQKDIASALVRNGADMDCWSEGPGGSYWTLLHRAIDDRNESIAQFLIQNGCDMNAARRPGPDGRSDEEARNQQSPLHMCCKSGLETVARTLIEHGADINSKNIEGKTPLHIALENKHFGVTSLLLSRRELDLTVRDKAGITPFAVAVRYRNDRAAQAILCLLPTASEQYDDKGRNLLHKAIQEGDTESALFMLSIYVKPNSRVQDTSQTTPLQLAAAAGSEVLVRTLLLSGAKVNYRDVQQRTALHVAAGAGHVAVVSALLQNDADPNASDSEGNNALHIACREGQLGTARIFLTEPRLDAEVANLKGRNPLHELANASKDTAAEIAESFIDCMPHYPLDEPDLDGNTALHLAFMKGNGNLCRSLARYGASLGTMNKDGITIFDYQFATKQFLHSFLDDLSQMPPLTEGDICLECGIKFGLTIHKHHCHHCGRILCSKCSDREVPILKFGLDQPMRVCRVCFSLLHRTS